MAEEKYRTHELCQFDYSDIWEKSFDENRTDKALRNDEVVKLLNEKEEMTQELKKYISRVLFVLACSQLPKDTRLSVEEIEAISKLQDFVGEKIVDLEKKCNNKSGGVE